MPEKEKVKDVQALADTLDSLPETVKQRILGVAEGYQLAIDANKERKGARAHDALPENRDPCGSESVQTART